jgi:hypothetical protein
MGIILYVLLGICAIPIAFLLLFVAIMLIIFAFYIPVSGISEIYSDISKIQNNNEEVLDSHNTIPGYIYGIFEKDNKTLDEYFFDELVFIIIKIKKYLFGMILI